MNKTRICSLLLALLMVVGLFSFVACQNEPAANENDPSAGDVADKPDEGENSDQTDKPNGTETPDNQEDPGQSGTSDTGDESEGNGNANNETDEPQSGDTQEPVTDKKPVGEIRKTMKVLTLGNSFSENAHRYLIDIMKAQGMDDIILGNVVYTACSLQAHYSKAQSGVRDCIYYKFTLKDGEFAEGTNNGKVTTPRYNVNFAFEDEDWDIVILQQVSGQSGIVSSYSPHLDNLVNYIKG
ncbi:MAG: DUF4886 domain-containing protein [Clostridia bacterium]|nr:DUF4886 domain-containing protein [Clostridia bacterium]